MSHYAFQEVVEPQLLQKHIICAACSPGDGVSCSIQAVSGPPSVGEVATKGLMPKSL